MKKQMSKKNEIKTLLKANMSNAVIAKKVGCCIGYIYNIKSEMKSKNEKLFYHVKQEAKRNKKEKIERLLRQEKKANEIAKLVKCKLPYVYNMKYLMKKENRFDVPVEPKTFANKMPNNVFLSRYLKRKAKPLVKPISKTMAAINKMLDKRVKDQLYNILNAALKKLIYS